MKSMAIYARVSSEQQVQQATIESQISALSERACADGFAVLPSDIYADDGVSGTILVRPALERLRDRIADGEIDRLYVHSPDRLARKYAYQVVLLEEFHRAGVEVVFLNGPTGRTAEDELLVQVQGIIAEYERARIVERSRRGKIHKARAGSVSVFGRAPYGYRLIRERDGEPAHFQVVLPEAAVVRKVFEWLVHEHLALFAIAKRLTGEGVPAVRSGREWGPTSVHCILSNPAYKGTARYLRNEAVERRPDYRPSLHKRPIPRRGKSSSRPRPVEETIAIPVPPIVSADLFEAAQEQLRRNRRMATRNARAGVYLLQGLTVCANCHYSYGGGTSKIKKVDGTVSMIRYLFCTQRPRKGDLVCRSRPVRADQLEAHVWTSVRGVLQDPSRSLEEWTSRTASDGTVAALREQHELAQKAVSAAERGLRRLMDAYEAGVIELSELSERRERLRQRLNRAQEELEGAAKRLHETVQLTGIIANVEGFREQLAHGLDSATWDQKRHIIRSLVERIEISDQAVTIVYRVPRTPRSGARAPDSGDSEDRTSGLHPQRVRPHRLIGARVFPAFHLRRPVARTLHHAADRLHRHLDAGAAELVADLRRAEPLLLPPLPEDRRVTALLDGLRVRAARRRRALALRRLRRLALPVPQRVARDPELLGRRAHPDRRDALQRLRDLRRRVHLRDARPSRRARRRRRGGRGDRVAGRPRHRPSRFRRRNRLRHHGRLRRGVPIRRRLGLPRLEHPARQRAPRDPQLHARDAVPDLHRPRRRFLPPLRRVVTELRVRDHADLDRPTRAGRGCPGFRVSYGWSGCGKSTPTRSPRPRTISVPT